MHFALQDTLCIDKCIINEQGIFPSWCDNTSQVWTGYRESHRLSEIPVASMFLVNIV